MAAPLRFDPDRAEECARLGVWLAGGGIAALPTDTVPGLAALAIPGGAPAAVARLAALKGAPADKPCALHLADLPACTRLAPFLPPGLPRWLRARLPGPWTVLLPSRWLALAPALDWHWPLVGLRVPRSARFSACARAAGGPLLLTSINRHGDAPLTHQALADWLAERRVPAAFDPAREEIGTASRVVAFDPLPRALRGEIVAADLRPGMRVLVVCSGNICRSPLAAAILKQEIAAAWGVLERDLTPLGWTVDSAGTFAMSGVEASEHSVAVARELGLDLRGHRARTVMQALAGADYDLVLGMGSNHLASLAEQGVQAEIFDPALREVTDPFGADLAAYRRMREHLQRAAQERVEAWSRWGAGQDSRQPTPHP
jgi:protein-tyrosine-phosphatase/tRNA A37 threonylcarbamoyladenosine synthetase subunit TsaC/SUA5/YrdC